MATIDNLPLQQGLQPTHLESGDADAFVLGSELLKDNPFLLNTYYKQSNNNMTTLQKFKTFFPGRLNIVTRQSYSPLTGHWEKPRWNKNITVGSIAAGPNANESIITLTATDMVTDTVAESGLTYLRSRPRVGETMQFQAGGIKYWIVDKNKDVNPHTITIKSADDSDPMDAIVAGDVGTVMEPVKGEGTGQIAPLTVRRYKYTNRFVITADTDAVTGSHMTTTARFQPVPGSNLLFLEGLQDMEVRHQMAKGYIWMFSDEVTPNNWVQQSEILQENVAVMGTQGLIPYIQQSGRVFEYDPNDFDITDFYALTNYYHGINIGTSNLMLVQGYGINQIIETSLADRINYEWVIGVSDKYVNQSMRRNWAEGLGREYNPQGAFYNLGITGFALGQFVFMQTASPEFNDMQGPGVLGYNNWMLALPFDYANVEGDRIPYLGYEFRGADGYNREDEVWTKTGAGKPRAVRNMGDFVKTSQYDGSLFYVRSEIAPHFALGEQFSMFVPSTTSS